MPSAMSVTTYPQLVSSALVTVLYRYVATLDKAWANARLHDEFGSRAVELTLRLLECRGRCLNPHDIEEEQALIAEARQVLRKCYTRNARRDYFRHRADVERWYPLSLEQLAEEGWQPDWHDDEADDDHILESRVGKLLINELQQKYGFSEIQAHFVILDSVLGNAQRTRKSLEALGFENIRFESLRKYHRGKRHIETLRAILVDAGLAPRSETVAFCNPSRHSYIAGTDGLDF